MPNWCRGNIRFRGKRDNVVKLILYALRHNGRGGELIFKDNYLKLDEETDFYITGTNRCFVTLEKGYERWIPVPNDPDKEVVVSLDGFHAAWCIRSDGFIELAKEYQVDIKCVGFESGMCFSQVMTFLRDGKKKEDYKEYEDWEWDSLFPNMGG